MASINGIEEALHAMRILRRREIAPASPCCSRSSFEEERQEALEGVLDAMATTEPDADHAAACSYLLRHLASAPRC
jgi:hypothetical protein